MVTKTDSLKLYMHVNIRK